MPTGWEGCSCGRNDVPGLGPSGLASTRGEAGASHLFARRDAQSPTGRRVVRCALAFLACVADFCRDPFAALLCGIFLGTPTNQDHRYPYTLLECGSNTCARCGTSEPKSKNRIHS